MRHALAVTLWQDRGIASRPSATRWSRHGEGAIEGGVVANLPREFGYDIGNFTRHHSATTTQRSIKRWMVRDIQGGLAVATSSLIDNLNGLVADSMKAEMSLCSCRLIVSP